MKRKMTIECQIEIDDEEPIYGVQLHVSRRGVEWENALLAMFPRPHRVRKGKYLILNDTGGKVLKRGDD